ncbi:MAG: sulfurtransferase complex subunit TusB [Burkholderiaceae bacterium]
MLHIVNRSPLNTTAFDTLDRLASHGALLLIEDAVYAATEGNAAAGQLARLGEKLTIYALAPDLQARGMADRVLPSVNLVDYAGFVDLVVEQPNCQSWL